MSSDLKLTDLDPVDTQVSTVVLPNQKSKKQAHRSRPTPDDEMNIELAARTNRDSRWDPGVDWPVVVWMGAVHVGALAAPFFFSWKGLALMFVLYWLTGGVGICLGFHRYLTHGGFRTWAPVRWLLVIIGTLAGEGSALTWTANHRKHHVFSDQEGDPHSPMHGGFWSHFIWFMPRFTRAYHDRLLARYVPELQKEKFLRFMHNSFLVWHLVLGGLIYAVGYYVWDTKTAISLVTWGVFFRMVWTWHITWFVNSASHMWGYRNYETTDDSRNLWWVGLLAWGEGWHNNHHAYQRMARHGHRWWEVDVTYWTICAMEKLGLVWDVVHDVPSRQRVIAAEITADKA